MNKYILLILCWIAYYIFHSLFATDFFKKKLLFLNKYYRLLYNVISILGFLALLLYTATIPPEWLFSSNSVTKFFGLMPTTYGILIIKKSFKSYSMKDFLGAAHLKSNYKEESFVSNGILKHIRHPLYLGTLLIICGFFIFSPSISNLIIMLVSISYIFIGIYFEEKKLVNMYGKQYQDYKKEVPMILPKSIKIFS